MRSSLDRHTPDSRSRGSHRRGFALLGSSFVRFRGPALTDSALPAPRPSLLTACLVLSTSRRDLGPTDPVWRPECPPVPPIAGEMGASKPPLWRPVLFHLVSLSSPRPCPSRHRPKRGCAAVRPGLAQNPGDLSRLARHNICQELFIYLDILGPAARSEGD